mmetsp:Transcript_27707/g.59558  ORF Transcript_27707/g.59558 Transcript_27707/m.59558 type:complete len:419 (+) Transcript_27707:165-1421(+)
MHQPFSIRSDRTRRAASIPVCFLGAQQQQQLWRKKRHCPLSTEVITFVIVAMVATTLASTTPSSSPLAFGFAPSNLNHLDTRSRICNTATFNGGHFLAVVAGSNNANNIHEAAASPEAASSSPDDLTKEVLLVRLSEVRDYYRQHPEEGMTQANVCLLLLRTRLPNLRLNRCFVAPSTISDAGNGVFANRDIEEGELITLYPGDAVLVQDSTASDSGVGNDDVKNAAPPPPVGIMFGNHVPTSNRDTNRVTNHEARSYEMEINKYTSIIADPLVQNVENHAYMGHMCNDGAAVTAQFDEESRAIYAAATEKACNAKNVVMEGSHVGTISTRAIRTGEEIFVSYEAGHWLSRSDSSLITKKTKTGVVVEIGGGGGGKVQSNNRPEATVGTESRDLRRRRKKLKKAISKGKQKKNKGFGT